MNGPTEFHVIGSMKEWTIIDRLAQIQIPVLLISGRYDEATPEVVQPFMDHIVGARWVIFDASSHMPHVEERDLCMKTVSDFLSSAIASTSFLPFTEAAHKIGLGKRCFLSIELPAPPSDG